MILDQSQNLRIKKKQMNISVSLKKANLPTIIVFLLWNIVLFLAFYNGLANFWESAQERVAELTSPDSLFCFLTPLVVIIATGLLPPSWKATLVFWRFKYALPGCRAYSKIARNDDRIDVSKLEKAFNASLATPREENVMWYNWYKTVENNLTVREAHKSFLLNRDLTGISFLFLLFGTFALILSKMTSEIVFAYAVILFIEYLLFSIIARNYGNRFVCNVIVEYLK